jgi:hypothetical protein
MAERPSKWVIRVMFNDRQSRYYANAREYEYTPYRGSAARYESEADAKYHAYELKHRYNRHSGWSRITDVAVEEIKNPRRM